MPILTAALLGVVQGLTEFLPVSSSAHLILARAFFGWDADRFGLAFDVACHVGTLVAVLVYFRQDLADMVLAFPQAFGSDARGPARRVRLIAVGTIPVVIAGALLSGLIERALRTPLVAAVNLAAVAFVFLAAERRGPHERSESTIAAGEAAVLGCAQATALVPGVSRSGATIATAMLFGVRRDEAARFSFLLGVPAIVAAAGKEGLDLARQGFAEGEVQLFTVGTVASAVVGYLTVKYFIRYLAGHSLRPFAWYRLALAAATAAWWVAGLLSRG